MIWENLKDLSCPNCSESVERSSNLFFKCESCNFVISEAKLRKMVEKMFNDSKDHFGRANFEDTMDLTKTLDR